jgi:hypothetical protein
MPFTIASFVLAIAGSLAARVIMSLGMGWISYQGIMLALDQVTGFIVALFTTASPIINVLLLAGMGHSVGILLAAITTRAMMFGFAQLGKVIS